jgi:hypothetical protein
LAGEALQVKLGRNFSEKDKGMRPIKQGTSLLNKRTIPAACRSLAHPWDGDQQHVVMLAGATFTQLADAQRHQPGSGMHWHVE